MECFIQLNEKKHIRDKQVFPLPLQIQRKFICLRYQIADNM